MSAIGMRACEIVWDAEEAQQVDEMMERSTGHPCPGSVGGDCPILPRSTSSIAKQHADPRAVIAYAEQQAAEQQSSRQSRSDQHTQQRPSSDRGRALVCRG